MPVDMHWTARIAGDDEEQVRDGRPPTSMPPAELLTSEPSPTPMDSRKRNGVSSSS